MAFASFCGLLTLQVGSAILATVFFVVGLVTFGVNVFDYHEHPRNSWPVDLVLVCIFVVFMVVAGIIMFMAAYNESRSLCLMAVGVIAVVMLYWLILTIFSFVNVRTDVRRVCVQQRCGSSFWIANLHYRARSRVIADTHTTVHGNTTGYTTEPTSSEPQTSSSPSNSSSKTSQQPVPPTTATSQTVSPVSDTSQPVPPMPATSQPVTPVTETSQPVPPTSGTSKPVPPTSDTSQPVPPTTATSQTVPPTSGTSQSVPPTPATSQPVTSATSASQPVTPATSASQPVTPATSASQPVTPATSASQPVTQTNPTTDSKTDITSTATGRKKRQLDGQVYFNQDGQTMTSPNQMSNWPEGPALDTIREQNLHLRSLSKLDSEDYEEGDDSEDDEQPTDDRIGESLSSESNGYVFGAAFVGAIIFSIVNLVFLIFAMIIMWSYAQELKWGAYYYDSNTPSYR